MNPLDPLETFWETGAVLHALERSGKAAGTALSVHTMTGEKEKGRVAGWGGSKACTYVASLPWGAQTCRRSREKAAAAALRRGLPVPFLCHMGFSCVAVAAPADENDQCVITYGPFCPKETPDSLERDAMDGLETLERKVPETLPFALDDIPTVATESVLAVAEWTRDTLRDQRPAVRDDGEHDAESIRGKTRAQRRTVDPYSGADLAAGLLGGQLRRVRALVKGLLTETEGRPKDQEGKMAARALAVVAAAIDAAEKAGADTASAWERLGEFSQRLPKAQSAKERVDAAMYVLKAIRADKACGKSNPSSLGKLNRLVEKGLATGITLNDVAKSMGEAPSALTHRLQRQFGMSFSEYKGRLRVDRAKALLQRTSLTVKEVALRVGASDTSNLNKLFKKHEGTSPSEYRKHFGKKK